MGQGREFERAQRVSECMPKHLTKLVISCTHSPISFHVSKIVRASEFLVYTVFYMM